jgi:hypothetical protein
MSALSHKIGIRDVERLQPGQVLWDSGKGGCIGFCARRQKGTTVSYGVMYRTKEGRQRLFTIGKHGSPWVPETAREEARKLLAIVKDGGDPMADKYEAAHGETMAELLDRYIIDVRAGHYLSRTGLPKRPTTIAANVSQIESLIKPKLGKLRVCAVSTFRLRRHRHARPWMTSRHSRAD